MFAKWQAITLWRRVLIGMVIGLALGLTLHYGLPPLDVSITAEVSVEETDDSDGEGNTSQLGLVTSVGTPITFTLFEQGLGTNKATVSSATSQDGTVSINDEGAITYTPNVGFSGNDKISIEAVEPHGRGIVFANNWIQPFGDLFVRLIKMLIIPLIATTLVAGVTAMGDPKKLGSLGIKTIALYLATTFFAVSLGLAIGTLLQPGVGIDFSNVGQDSIADVQGKIMAAGDGDIVKRLLEIVPTNPIQALASGDVLATIFFAIMIGIGILLAGEVAKPVKDFFDSAAEVVMKITVVVMELAPYGVLALMAWVMATRGVEVLSNLAWLAAALYLSCILQIIFVYGGLIIKCLLRLPLTQFFKGVADAQGLAFSTSSSSATLPMTISCAESNLGVSKSVAGSVLPLGATINMDGTAIYLGLIALFAAQALQIELEMYHYVMVAITATLASIGAAGIPSAGLLLAATVLAVIGVKDEKAVLIIAFIFPFDRLLDMMRTVTNVTGDIAVACTVAKWEGELDEAVFKSEAEM